MTMALRDFKETPTSVLCTVIVYVTRVRFSHEDAITDLGAERDRVLAVWAGGGLLKGGVDRTGPVVATGVDATLTIHFQHQLVRGGLDEAQDLVSWPRHDVRRLDEHHVISRPQSGTFRGTSRVHAFHSRWSAPRQRESPWDLSSRKQSVRGVASDVVL